MDLAYRIPRVIGIYDGIGPKAKLLGQVVYNLYKEPVKWPEMRERGMYAFSLGVWQRKKSK